jgi:hypothetical protein
MSQLTKLQRLNKQDAEGNFLNLDPPKSKEINISRETFNTVKEQMQNDLICLLDRGTITVVDQDMVDDACQIVVDNFKKLDLTN